MRKTGFTLIEVLIVIVIIGILAAIAFPVIGRAKLSAKKATTISNLRQCATAALIYEGDDGDIPTREASTSAFERAPTCDPMDYWRNGCSIQWGNPMVGSYGYVRGVDEFQDEEVWAKFKASVNSYPMFAAVWYSDQRLMPFRGSAPTGNCIGSDEGCMFPSRIVYAMHDGSILNWKGKKYRSDPSNQSFAGWAFTWSNVFNDELFVGK